MLQAAPDAGRRESRGRDLGTEQVPIAQQELAVGPQAVLLAVGDKDELFIFPQLRRQPAAQGGKLLRVAPFDARKDEPRYHAFAQFVDQEALGRRR